jgi:hypothetical protein
MSGPAGSYYFGLFVYGQNHCGCSFTRIYAMNTGIDGLFGGGTASAPGWEVGTGAANTIPAGFRLENSLVPQPTVAIAVFGTAKQEDDHENL